MTDESMSYLDALKEIKRLKETLNKIRAEIEDIPNNPATKPVGTFDYVTGATNERRIVLEIIDKHLSELRGDTEESDAEFMCKVMSKTVNKSVSDKDFIGGF